MRKMLFSKEYGLLQSVLSGKKTMTRRFAKLADNVNPPINIGDVVAIAQPYKDINDKSCMMDNAGYNNPMFVKASLMEHFIEITNVRLERLQDISKEDMLKEGILVGEFENTTNKYYYDRYGHILEHKTFPNARNAFISLINNISKKDVWAENPFVWVYEFKLVV